MKWRGREQSSNIEDRRGQSTGGLGGLGGSPFGRGGGIRIPTGGGSRGGIGSLIGIVVVLGIIWAVTGTNPIDILSGGSSSGSSASSSSQLPTTGDQAELRDFVGVVVKETEDM
jgi:predicted metalloprotease